MTGIPIPVHDATKFDLVLAAPHCAVVPFVSDGILHGVSFDGWLTDRVTAACGAIVKLLPVGPEDQRTTWPWPPRVADCRRLGLTRCPDCADALGTRNPSTLTEARP